MIEFTLHSATIKTLQIILIIPLQSVFTLHSATIKTNDFLKAPR